MIHPDTIIDDFENNLFLALPNIEDDFGRFLGLVVTACIQRIFQNIDQGQTHNPGINFYLS